LSSSAADHDKEPERGVGAGAVVQLDEKVPGVFYPRGLVAFPAPRYGGPPQGETLASALRLDRRNEE
jgi:hypothetical protein